MNAASRRVEAEVFDDGSDDGVDDGFDDGSAYARVASFGEIFDVQARSAGEGRGLKARRYLSSPNVRMSAGGRPGGGSLGVLPQRFLQRLFHLFPQGLRLDHLHVLSKGQHEIHGLEVHGHLQAHLNAAVF